MTATRLLGLMCTALVIAGCAPWGPNADSLAQEPEFASAMPGAEIIRDGGADPRWNIEGSTNAHASNIWISDASPDEVVAWYTAQLEGWTPDVYPHITMLDGHFPEHAWRRDELVIALGFPDPGDDAVDRLELNLEGRTLYHTSITYQPED